MGDQIMSTAAPLQVATAKPALSSHSLGGKLLQRKCACGSSKSPLGEMCDECQSHALQRKLTIGASNDPLEQEADRIADQVMAAPAHPAVSAAPPRIQRLAAQPAGGMETAPASVDQALASPGRPLEPALRQDMEQRFGHDFSRVRVHTGSVAEQSVRDVNAHAYTMGHNIAFDAGRFSPGTHEGRRLIAHELTHVVQQATGLVNERIQAKPNSKRPATQSKVNKPALPVTYTQNAAAPSKVDFGKISPGMVGFEEVPIYNLTRFTASVRVFYQGDPAITIIRSPQWSREAGVQMAEKDRNVRLAFNAPAKHGSHYGTLSIYIAWYGGANGPAPETLTVPVVAHALEEWERTPDEWSAETKLRKIQADEEAAMAKRQVKEERELKAFSKAHPNVETDNFRSATGDLIRATHQIHEMRLSGVETAKDEVLKYKKKPPPEQNSVIFDLAMLALDIASAGVAGFIAKTIERNLKQGLRKFRFIGWDTPPFVPSSMEVYKTSTLSEETIALITDGIKESVKGASRLARKNSQNSKPGITSDLASSDDPRIAFFEAQRVALILAETDLHEGFMRSVALLRPTVFKNEAVAVAAVVEITKGIRAQLINTSKAYAAEAIRQWIIHISELSLDVNRVASVEAHGIGELKGVVDIGFQAGRDPRQPVSVKSAIIRGISNTAAHRLTAKPLLELGVPVRAYGMPGPGYAELLVTVVRSADGDIRWIDMTSGLGPASEATWLKRKGGTEEKGAKILIEREIMSKSLNAHGIQLTTDQDPGLEGG
jgi:hypothetical protein